jgi:hypothetical protein
VESPGRERTGPFRCLPTMAPHNVEKLGSASGFQFRFRLGQVFVRCLVRDTSVRQWTHVQALGDLDAIKAYARRIVRFHLRGKPAASAWVVEIGPNYVHCEAEQPIE